MTTELKENVEFYLITLLIHLGRICDYWEREITEGRNRASFKWVQKIFACEKKFKISSFYPLFSVKKCFVLWITILSSDIKWMQVKLIRKQCGILIIIESAMICLLYFPVSFDSKYKRFSVLSWFVPCCTLVLVNWNLSMI